MEHQTLGQRIILKIVGFLISELKRSCSRIRIVIFHICLDNGQPNFLRLNHLDLLSKFEFGSNCHYWPLRVIKTLTPLCAASAHVRSSGEPLPLLVTVDILGQYDLSFSYVVVHLFPSWLVLGRNQVYCACCSVQATYKTNLNWICKV